MDYYSTLGLNPGASAEEIKKAYRSLAMKHHPDRGGDEKKFKEISAAFETLSDPQKKQMIDSGLDPNNPNGFHNFHQQGPFEFHFNTGNFNDIFESFGFGFGNRPQRKNRNISIHVEITLEEVLTGKDLNAEIQTPTGKSQTIAISIPPGVEHGQQIRYGGMGEKTINGIPPGDLLVNVHIRDHEIFQRNHDCIICDKTISVWDAILGSSVEIVGLNSKKFSVSVPPGTQPNTVLSCKGEGLPQLRSGIRGDLLIRIRIEIPARLSDTQKKLIETIKQHGI
jgi:curved DNA-binding protein